MAVPQMPRKMRTAAIWAVCVIALAIAARIVYAALYSGPTQPIPFSHRIHAGTKDISCFFCHPDATHSSNPGMPPVEKCLLCHNIIASRFPPIAKIREYKAKGQGIPWVRVNVVPDFVHFSHQAHLARRFDCGRCHGNVRKMDRIKLVHRLDMNFCVTCHKDNAAPVDCVTCHY